MDPPLAWRPLLEAPRELQHPADQKAQGLHRPTLPYSAAPAMPRSQPGNCSALQIYRLAAFTGLPCLGLGPDNPPCEPPGDQATLPHTRRTVRPLGPRLKHPFSGHFTD